MKVVTVTLNPAIDKTIYVNELSKDEYNQIEKNIIDIGGKGINVSKTLKALGVESTVITFAGGREGRSMVFRLKDEGICSECIPISSEIRTNYKIIENNGIVTELNEKGPYIADEELKRILSCIEYYADEETLFVLSGSIPRGVPKDIYAQIIELVHKKKAKVFLDTSKDALEYGIDAEPDFIKPNRDEILEYLKEETISLEQLRNVGQDLLKKNIKMVIISLGKDGAIFFNGKEILYAKGMNVPVRSTVGAGDALVAACIYGMMKQCSFLEMVKLSMAVSTGTVLTEGTKPAKEEDIIAFYNKVEIIR